MRTQIITGDCLDVLRSIEPGSARLIFADPPYNIGIDYCAHHDDRMKPADYRAWCGEWIDAAARLLTRDGSLWVLISHEQSPYLRIALEDAGLHHQQTIVWYESFGVYCPRKFGRCSRPLLWMVRNPRAFVFNADAVRCQSVRQRLGDERANPAGKILDDVWEIPRVAGTHAERIAGFPTQLPRELLRRVVGCASDPGDLVVDPFSGTATTGVVCLELSRQFIGIEQSERWAEASWDRLENTTPGLPFD
jgi:site-specific DNA-methyltransferase (adenine-specific)